MKTISIPAESRARKLSPLRPETLRIQGQLVAWTKSGRKHWDLFRHILNPHLLADATGMVLRNAGSHGIDEVTCAEVKAQGWEFVKRLREKLKAKTYRPQAVRRVYIPKRDGRKRPLGIPTVEDRVVQRALALLLEPIYELSFLPCSYGFRPKRRAVQCVYDIAKKAYTHRFIIDADIDFFGISIYVQFMDHNPPHIHAIYNAYKASYEIASGQIIAGKMSKRADKLIREWVGLRQAELKAVWDLAKDGKQVFPIPPLG